MSSDVLEGWVRDYLSLELGDQKYRIKPPVVQQFPDVIVDQFGIEVKYTSGSSWTSVANSINESHSVPNLEAMYVLFGRGDKLDPGARIKLYEHAVVHARTSHRPRFEVDMNDNKESLFVRWGIGYEDFRRLSWAEKMGYMTAYVNARRQVKKQDFWWLPPDPKVFNELDRQKQDAILAQTYLLCPQIADASDSSKGEFAICALQMHAVVMTNISEIVGNPLIPELSRLEKEILRASDDIISDAFTWHWGVCPPRDKRIYEWISRLQKSTRSREDFFGGLFEGKYKFAEKES